jgi:soluble lytic murein transglycosylase-like protein
MVLVAYHLLGSSLGAYIEWSVNELMMNANTKKYKDETLSNASYICNKPTSQKALHNP